MLKIVNEFHGFEKVTKSDSFDTIIRIVRSSKPSDCTSVTRVYEVTDAGEVTAQMHIDRPGKRLLREAM